MVFDLDIEHRVGARPASLRLATDARLVALVGPSGAGKTTLMNCIAGLVTPLRGRIAVAEQVLFDSDAGIDIAPDRRRAGYVFQDLRLFPHRTVRGNLAYGERPSASGPAPFTLADIAAFLEIDTLLDRWPANLSGGEQRRVAIGRALLARPRFLLLDEPFASLDRARANTLHGLVERVRDEFALPTLLVTHDMAEVSRLAAHVVPIE